MKEKKTKGTSKVLLMVISVALTAAVSVSATLAYLTAKTDPKDNKFQASGGINGRILEPSYSEENATNFVPGKTVDKDPIIDNETSDSNIYVGAKVEFLINVTDDADKNYVAVNYATFSKFVTVAGLTGANWVEYTTTDGVAATDKNKYYFYNQILYKDADTGATVETNPAQKDYTEKLFTSVTPKAEITIVENGTATSADLTASADLSTLKFKAFNFKIKITGYGIKADNTVDAATAKSQILIGLGGKSA